METQFIQNGISFLEGLTKSKLLQLYKKANDDYYNKSKPILTDSQFDILKDYVEKKYPNEITIGAPIVKKKIKLPFFMASMNKIKPDEKMIENWKSKYTGDYVLSTKVDGISALYDTKEQKLYTRGDGEYGQDISHLIPYLRFPPIRDNLVIRGELIISKNRFPEISSIRNVVSGVVNSKNIPKDKIGMIDFVSYEIVYPFFNPLEQMRRLREIGIETVKFVNQKDVTAKSLSDTLLEWRNTYEYDIDGIIVTHNKIYPRKNENPKHSFAFKMILTEQMMETTVLEVQWNISKDGYLKPKVKLEPVYIGGTKIEYATAFNANYVETNQIGIGSVVQLIRSGDVIPHILQVTQPTVAMFPTNIEYIWNDTHVDIVVKQKEHNPLVKKRELIYFFKGLKVDGLGEKRIEKLFEKGYTTISSLLFITENDLKSVEGIEDKLAKKIFISMTETIQKTSLAKLLSLSNIFDRGVGEKKLDLLFDKIPDWYFNKDLEENIANIKGFTKTSAKQIVNKMEKIQTFLKDTKLEYKLNTNRTFQKKQQSIRKDISMNQLEGKMFVFTGIRDKKLEETIMSKGGKISSTITKNTFKLIVKSLDDSSVKMKKALEFNIPISIYPEY
jgi:NAD-dependent DNA ligase